MLGIKGSGSAQSAHCLLKDVGVNSINRQHLRLASYAVEFNQIIEELAERAPTNEDWRHIDALFSRVTLCVQTHFREEEELMKEHQYPAYEAHKRLHDQFTANLIDVQSKINNRKVAFGRKIAALLWDWLMHHINEEDYKYREFFQEKGLR